MFNVNPLRVLLVLLICVTISSAADLRTLSGKTLQGDLVRVTEKEVLLKTDTGETATPLADVARLDLQPASASTAPARFTLITLTDGSQLQCGKFAVRGPDAELTLAAEGKDAPTFKVPLAAIASVLVDAHDPAVQQEWQEKYIAKKSNEDLLKIKTANGSQRLEGTFGNGDADGKKIEFKVGSKSYQLDLTRIEGMLFLRRAAGEMPVAVCRVLDIYRNNIAAVKVETAGDTFAVTTAAGTVLNYPRALVVGLEFGNDKIAFLTDLAPQAANRFNVFRWRDGEVSAAAVRMGGVKYPSALLLHSPADLVYDLGGKYKEFKAILGMDEAESKEDRNDPRVRIEGDGRELFAGVISRKDKPRELTLDVKGVRSLRITVESQNALDNSGEQVALADAKVSK